MSKIVITTVGTSLIERKENKINGTKPYAPYADWGQYDKDNDDEIPNLRNRLEKLLVEKQNKKDDICAEVKSCVKIQETYPNLEVYLICTDTILSPLCAEYIKQILESKGMTVHFDYSKGLDMKSDYNKGFIIEGLIVDGEKASDTFQNVGFPKLIEIIKNLEKAAGDNRPILNITGGYKALIPVMTIMGQLYNMEVNYVYEDSEELIKIGTLPVSFDWALGELYADFISDKEVREQLPPDSEILKKLREFKIIKLHNLDLTIVGTLLEKYIDDRMFEGNTSFGYFAEYKVFESFIINPYLNSRNTPIRGEMYWWNLSDKSDYSKLPQFEKDKTKEIAIELDVVLSDAIENQIWVEVKSYSKSGLRKALSQIIQRLEFNQKALKANVDEFFLVLYKFDFQTMKVNQQIKGIAKLFDNSGIKFKIWYFDVPANIETDKILNKAFFESKLNLTHFKLD